MDALHQARTEGTPPDPQPWAVQRALLDWLESGWRQPDMGLWESRGDPRHFVHSKVMCWVGFDRGIRSVEAFGADGPAQRWRALRDEVHAEVCRDGWDPARPPFPQSSGSTELAPSLLMIPLVGFLPPASDPFFGTPRP